MASMATGHATELIEVGVTMAQAKALFVLVAAPEMHMSNLSAQLGVSLSTTSGLVDRLVDQGLVDRHHDPTDRRHVVVSLSATGRELIERFRELSGRRLSWLLEGLDEGDLDCISRVMATLSRRAASMSPVDLATLTDPIATT